MIKKQVEDILEKYGRIFKANFDDRINILESIEDACNKFGAEYNYYRLSILAYAKQNIADAIKYAKKLLMRVI